MTEPSSTAESRGAPAVDAGRGVAWVGAAKGLFILSGLAIQLLVPRLLGPVGYGQLAAATAALAIVTNTLTTTLVQTASKLVSSAEPAQRDGVERGVLRFAVGLGLGLGALFLATSFPLARFVLRDTSIAPLLAVGGLVIAAYAIYATAIGILNGRRTFAAQARLDATFSTVRAGGQIGGAALGLGALGVMFGFGAAAVALAAVGVVAVLGRGAKSPPELWQRFLATVVPLSLMQLALNGVLQLDVEVLKAELAQMYGALGHSVATAAERSSYELGCYRAAQQLAFLPYQLSIAVTLVLFPVVSHARQTDDPGQAKRATEGAFRFTVLLLFMLEAALVAGGAGAIRLVLPDEFAPGADALPVLALGQIAFALFALSATVLAGAGAFTAATRSAVVGLISMLGTLALGVWLAGVDGPVRVAAALGSALGATVALLLALVAVKAELDARFPVPTLLRALGSAAVAVGLAQLIEGGALATIARLAVAVVVFVLGLVVSRELRAQDIALVRRVLGRKLG